MESIKMNNFEKKFKVSLFLPDEVVENILIRLSPKTAMRCRLVCRKWRDFTLSRDFVDLVSKNSIPRPTILVANPRDNNRLDLFALDEWSESARRKFPIHGFPLHSEKLGSNTRVVFSQDGLIAVNALFGCSPNDFVVLNPAYPEHVTITFSSMESFVYGVYYHPVLKEYCSLCKIGVRVRGGVQMEDKILSLGSSSSLRSISNPYDMRVEKLFMNPLLIGNYMYWLLKSVQGYCSGYNDIMEFDIIREEFKIIPCPVPLTTKCNDDQTCLVTYDGILAFLLVQPTKITIWRLKDRAVNSWTVVEYPYRLKNFSGMDKGIAIVGVKLALMLNRRLVVLNLVNGKVKNILKGQYGGEASFLSLRMSLASLKKCKSRIIIDKDGEVLDM